MENPLSVQLQEAWLQAQVKSFIPSAVQKEPYVPSAMKGQRPGVIDYHLGNYDDPGYQNLWNCEELNGNFGFSSHSLVQERRIEWTAHSGPDAAAEVLNDPVLQYIDGMLMEEDLEDRNCMEQECFAYQATAKGFYDILGEDVPNQVISQKKRSSVESEDEDDWINGVLNFEPETVISSDDSSGTTSSETIAASDVVSSRTWQNLCSPEWSQEPDDEVRSLSYMSSSDIFGNSQSNGLSDPLSNRVDLESHILGNGVYSRSVAETKVQEALQQSIFADIVFPHIGGATLKDTSRDSPLANGEFEQAVSRFNGNSNTGETLLFLHNRNDNLEIKTANFEAYREKVRVSNIALESSLHSNGAMPKRERFEKIASDKYVQKVHGLLDSEKAIPGLHNNLLQTPPVQVSLISTPVVPAEEQSVSYVQNENLNAECSAKILREGPLPVECNGKHQVSRKKQDSSTTSSKEGIGSNGKPVMVDLRALLITCSQAVAADDYRKANELLHEIREHASPLGSATQRLAHYFAEALVARLSGTGPRLYTAMSNNRPSAAQMLKAYHLYMATSPFKMLSHYFANHSILKAAEGSLRLHIVDFGILYGFQWPCLISALAERPGGPPHLRITGIEFPQPGYDPAQRIEETGRRLAEYARTYGVPFTFHAVANKWENVQAASLNIRQDEVLVVNCMFRLRQLMDETVITTSPRKVVLANIRSLKPKIFVEGVVNAGLNAPFFLSRFRESLFFFSSRFDAFDATMENENKERLMLEAETVGREILNIVACEGLDRIERPETYRQWQSRTQRAGFELLRLDPTVVAKARAIVKASYHRDYGVDDDGKWMLLGWKGRIMHALSAWKPIHTC
eukprot:c29155_g2_i1 orf=195-2756(-)